MSARGLTVHVCTEDGSRSQRALVTLLQRMLARTGPDGSGVVVKGCEGHRDVLSGNRWRAQKAPRLEKARRDLCQFLALLLCEPGGVVVFHVDADHPWAHVARSPGREDFEARIVVGVRHAITKGDADTALRGLVLCMPTYSLEAWMYQATERARQLCRDHHRGRHEEQFEAWGQDRAALDEVEKPKAQTCLKDHHNDELAKHVPLDEVIAVGKSLQAFVEALRASPLSAASR